MRETEEMKKLIHLLFIALFISGCATPLSTYLKDHHDMPSNIKDSMLRKTACVGMDREQVTILYGSPKGLIISDEYDKREMWVYDYYSYDPFIQCPYRTDAIYLTFDDGKVFRIENSKELNKRHANEYFAKYRERSEFKDSVLRESIRIGMNREEVKLTWGKPNDINRTVTQSVTHEQWVYGSKYLYFDNGILTSWQD